MEALLADDNYKDIIIGSLQFLSNEKRIALNAFFIINNHLHLIWQALQILPHTGADMQR